MAEETTPLTEQLHRSQIHQKIALAKRNHPDCVVVYFVRHKEAPPHLPKPTTPLCPSPYPDCSSNATCASKR